jgi:hypothetical protein
MVLNFEGNLKHIHLEHHLFFFCIHRLLLAQPLPLFLQESYSFQPDSGLTVSYNN